MEVHLRDFEAVRGARHRAEPLLGDFGLGVGDQQAMTQTTDGFKIAEMDLQLRGPGQFFGTRQHGLPEFKMADVTSEIELLKAAREDALGLLDRDPRLSSPQHKHLRAALIKQFGQTLQLAQVG